MDGSRPIGVLKASIAAATLAAVVLLAIVPAFACTPRAMAKIEPARGEAGTVAEVSGSLFGPDFGEVVIKWGGSAGTLLATAAVRPDGSFGPVAVTIPSAAEPGQVHIVSVYQPADPSTRVSNAIFTTTGTPAPAAPAPQAEPAPSSSPEPAAAATPTPSAAAAAPAASIQPAPVAAPSVVARAPAAPAAAAPAARSPAIAPPPTAAPATAQEPAAVAPPTVLEAPEPPGTDPARAGGGRAPVPQVSLAPAAGAAGDRSVIDAGPSLWALVPLIAMGLILFGAAAAVVVHEVRRRRQPVEL